MFNSSNPHNQPASQPTSLLTNTPKLKDRWPISPNDKTKMTYNTSKFNTSHSSSDSSSAKNSFILNASSNPNDPSTSNDSPTSNDPSSANDSPDSSSSPNNDPSSSIDPPNPATSSNPVQSVNYNDARCRFCDHNRLDCLVCRPQRTSHRANNKAQKKRHIKARGRVYCCKCSQGKKITRHFDPADKEKLALIKYATLKGIAAAELRSYIMDALKYKQCYSTAQLCGQISPIDLTDVPGSPLAITVMNCRIPETNNHSRQTLYNLDCTMQQVSNTVRRLICLLSSGRPIDAGILSSSLNALFNQLAFLNHRAFPALAPAIHPNKRSSRTACAPFGIGFRQRTKGFWLRLDGLACWGGLAVVSCGLLG